MAVTRFRFRRDPAAEWTAANPVLAEGEPGFERDTKRMKVGDGVTAWRDLPYVSVLRGADGRKYRLVSAVIRNFGTAQAPDWKVIEDANHQASGVSGVTITGTDTGDIGAQTYKALRVALDFTSSKVSAVSVTGDEQFVALGYNVGSSITPTYIDIYLTRPGLYDYVYYNGTNWVSNSGVFKNFTWNAGVLTMEHDKVGSSSNPGGSATHRGGNYTVGLGSLARTTTALEFYNFDGSKPATPTANMKAWVARSGPVQVDPASVTVASHNIWIHGVFEIA